MCIRDRRSIGRLDESIEVLVYADNLAPYSPTILTNLGNSYLDKGMLSEAEISYSKAIAYDACLLYTSRCV